MIPLGRTLADNINQFLTVSKYLTLLSDNIKCLISKYLTQLTIARYLWLGQSGLFDHISQAFTLTMIILGTINTNFSFLNIPSKAA